jgi:hypothetical protein
MRLRFFVEDVTKMSASSTTVHSRRLRMTSRVIAVSHSSNLTSRYRNSTQGRKELLTSFDAKSL